MMKKKLKYFLLLFVFLFVKLIAADLFSQPSAGIDKKSFNKALEKIANYMYVHPESLDDELVRIGYHPPSNFTSSQWVNFPAIRKIEMACTAANSSQVEGGEKALALLSRNLAQQYGESVLKDPDFEKFLNIKVVEKLIFVNPPIFPAKSIFSSNMKKAITKIASYYENANYLLIHYLNCNEEEAFEIERNSFSVNEALEKGFAKFSDIEQNSKMISIIKYTRRNYQSIRNDEFLSEFIKKQKPLIVANAPSTNKVINKNPNKIFTDEETSGIEKLFKKDIVLKLEENNLNKELSKPISESLYNFSSKLSEGKVGELLFLFIGLWVLNENSYDYNTSLAPKKAELTYLRAISTNLNVVFIKDTSRKTRVLFYKEKSDVIEYNTSTKSIDKVRYINSYDLSTIVGLSFSLIKFENFFVRNVPASKSNSVVGILDTTHHYSQSLFKEKNLNWETDYLKEFELQNSDWATIDAIIWAIFAQRIVDCDCQLDSEDIIHLAYDNLPFGISIDEDVLKFFFYKLKTSYKKLVVKYSNYELTDRDFKNLFTFYKILLKR